MFYLICFFFSIPQRVCAFIITHEAGCVGHAHNNDNNNYSSMMRRCIRACCIFFITRIYLFSNVCHRTVSIIMYANKRCRLRVIHGPYGTIKTYVFFFSHINYRIRIWTIGHDIIVQSIFVQNSLVRKRLRPKNINLKTPKYV